MSGPPAARAEAERAVAVANACLNRAEQVKNFWLPGREKSPESGELTPSLKLPRNLAARYIAANMDKSWMAYTRCDLAHRRGSALQGRCAVGRPRDLRDLWPWLQRLPESEMHHQ
ncbi:hypothetical protein Scani_30260 [Streptomyces caniferus]|uniref:Uncharacterized protein n=1 Tax=Streptomyces caniferus TaxID=285557 RepID=A0A640S6R0_9ACTN|nr:hypothetical protein Scani_30260 [Streptomyces caniferus]